jgi:23S rRNA (cytosine1962-C5)-methyltransferase
VSKPGADCAASPRHSQVKVQRPGYTAPAMELIPILQKALDAREPLLEPRHETALRLFNGFHEGFPALAIDLYGATLVVHDYADGPDGDEAGSREAAEAIRARLGWIKAALWKVREAPYAAARNGRMLFGQRSDLDRRVLENGVSYALALDLNRDASLYLDTRTLRAWAKEKLAGKSVLNTFAYTGSLGIAAMAGGARRVVHVDHNREFLKLAKDSYALNRFAVKRADFMAADFFEALGRLKKENALFDCAFLDPPFFSQTEAGRVDLEKEADRLVNKVRPLIGDQGWLVAVNNALFVSGAEWMASLEKLCAEGYLSLEETIPVPADTTGFPGTIKGSPPADPAPFNHSTKIAVLRVRRKDGRRAL